MEKITLMPPYYSKADVADLPVYLFSNTTDWLIDLHSREEQHCVISSFIWGRLLGDLFLHGAIDPESKHSKLLRGHLGLLRFGTKPYTKTVELFTDTYAHPELGSRIFPIGAEDLGSYILVPKDRQVALD